MLNDIIIKIREARVFEFLTVLPFVNRQVVKICQAVIDQLQKHPHQPTTVRQIATALRDQDLTVNRHQINHVIQALVRHEILVQRGDGFTFQTVVMSGHHLLYNHHQTDSFAALRASSSAAPSSSSGQSARPTSRSRSAVTQSPHAARTSFDSQIRKIKSLAARIPNLANSSESNQPTSRSAKSSLTSAASGGQSRFDSASSSWLASVSSSSASVSSEMAGDDGYSSPLNSYFSSVNRSLNYKYQSERSASNERSLSSASQQSAESSVAANPDLHHVLARNIKIPQPSSVPEAGSSSTSARQVNAVQSSGSSVSTSSVSAAAPTVQHDYVNDLQTVYNHVQFLSLISDPKRVDRVAKQEFAVVMMARRKQGIKSSDRLFKSAFKMNYREFGKVGNQINNKLMRLVSRK